MVVSVRDVGADDVGAVAVERHADRATLERVAELMRRGDLDPKITGIHPLDRAGAALATVESGHSAGKTVFDLSR